MEAQSEIRPGQLAGVLSGDPAGVPRDGAAGDPVTGQDLRTAREAKAVSLGTLSRLIGKSPGHLSLVETGKREVSPALVLAYERALGLSVAAAGRVRAALEPASAALVGDVDTGPHHQPDLAGLADEQAGALLRALVLAVGAAGLLAGPDQAVSAAAVPSVGVPPVVAAWTGREVFALRTAYRMSKRAFADRLGITHKAVQLWENWHRPIGAASQAALDTLLSRADPDTQARFWLVLSQTGCLCAVAARGGEPT